MANHQYRIVIEPLPKEEGGGYLAIVPDLPGCLSDGETDVQALENAHDAIEAWLSVNREMGRKDPVPEQQRHYA